MKVLVAGASSVLGLPTLRELIRRGHETYGLTRSRRHGDIIAANGATPVTADVFDPTSTTAVLDEVRPDAVVSLLITLPHFGPRHVRDYEATVELWRRGVPNLLDAAATASVSRFVAESVIFGYGYGHHDKMVDETDAYAAPSLDDRLSAVLSCLHDMERRVLDDVRLDGVVLRYGLFHGPAVPTTQLLIRALRWRLPVVPGEGRGLLSWIELSDAARATADAVGSARSGELYNITDDQPIMFHDYVAAVAATLDLPHPRRMPRWLGNLLMPLPTRFVDAIRLPVSNDKAARDLGWRPRHRNVTDMAQLLARDLGRAPRRIP